MYKFMFKAQTVQIRLKTAGGWEPGQIALKNKVNFPRWLTP